MPRCIFGAACITGIIWLGLSIVINSAFGRADNGDYGRFMAPFVKKPYGFETNWPPADPQMHDERFFQWWIPYWDRAELDRAQYFGSTALFWIGGEWLSKLFLGDGVISLRMSGAIASMVLAAAYVLILWSVRNAARSNRQLIVAVPLILLSTLIFSDVNYGSFMNSYFQEGGSFVFLACLFGAGVFFCSGSMRFSTLPVFAVAVCLFATARLQHGYVGPLLLVFLLARAMRHRPNGRSEWTGLIVSLLLIAMAMPASFWLNGHRHSRRNNAYHSLYLGILPNCDDPAAQIQAEGLPKDSIALMGQSAYTEEAGKLIEQTNIRLAHRSTLRIAMREPMAMARLIVAAAQITGDLDLTYLGMRQKGAVDYRSIPCGVRVWSKLRPHLIPRGGALLALLGLMIIGSTTASFVLPSDSTRSWALLCLLLSLISFLEICASAVGDGFYEIDRHLFASNLAMDLALCACLTLLISAALERRHA